jgi:hypothetical protein
VHSAGATGCVSVGRANRSFSLLNIGARSARMTQWRGNAC